MFDIMSKEVFTDLDLTLGSFLVNKHSYISHFEALCSIEYVKDFFL